MTRTSRTIIVAGLTAILSLSAVCHQAAFGIGRGGGGGGGGGRVGGGGGGGVGGGGGGGVGGGGARPATPAARPSAPAARPSTPASRPNVGSAPSFGGGNRPDVGNSSRPSTGGTGNRPSINPGNRPDLGDASGNRPSVGQGSVRPGNDRPQAGTLPGTRPGTGSTRPGTDRAGLSNRPNTLPGMDNRLPNGSNRLPNGGASVQDRRNDLQGRFQDRGNWQNNRQEYQTNRREDWQNWANGNRYGDWYHGYSYGGWWNHAWNNHPGWMAFGMTTWGMNRLAWGFGLGAYSNPYYVAPVGTPVVYNYSQPIVQQQPVYADDGSAAQAPSNAEMSTFDQARADFYAGNYPSALDNINATLKEMPNDAVVHEFRALVLFAMGRYNEAAATIHPVLAVGPGWDWPTLVGLYPSVDVYTEQLRNLENYVKANPNAADALFLMAYHYLTCDHKDAAHKTFEKVVSLQPNDTVAAQYVQLTGPETPQSEAPTPEPPAAAEIPADKLLSENDLIGKWKASGPNATTFNLEMTEQGQFTWTFTQGKNTQTMKGVFAIDQNQLALQPDSGGTMLADLTKKGTGFHFAMEGAPDKDPGLTFTK